MDSANRGNRRRQKTTGAKIAITATALAASVGGWAAFGMTAQPEQIVATQAALVDRTPTSASTTAPTTVPTAPAARQAPPAAQTFGGRGRHGRGTWTQPTVPDQTAPGFQPPAAQATPVPQTQPPAAQAPQAQPSAPATQPSRPQARTRSSR